MSGLNISTAFAVVTALVISFLGAEAVPVAMAMGCGKSGDLSKERRAFCCEHFNVNCSASRVPVSLTSLDVGQDSRTGKLKLASIQATVRLLGQDCKGENLKCATGLYCRRGICVRTRSVNHMKSLLKRGRLVEKEEREEIDPDSDEEREDPLAAREELIMRGQSLRTAQFEVRRNLKSQSSILGPTKTPSPRARVVPSVPSSNATSILQSPDKEQNRSQDDEPPAKLQLNEEEDEVASNIADLLSAKMGIELTSAELHSVRDVIAGTLDERAQREDEVAASQIGQGNESHDAGNLAQRLEAAEGEGPAQYHYYNHFEPLVQCSTERHRHASSKDSLKSAVGRTSGQ